MFANLPERSDCTQGRFDFLLSEGLLPGLAFPSKETNLSEESADAVAADTYERLLRCCQRLLDEPTRGPSIHAACAAIADLSVDRLSERLLLRFAHPVVTDAVAALEAVLAGGAGDAGAALARICLTIPDLLVGAGAPVQRFSLQMSCDRTAIVLTEKTDVRVRTAGDGCLFEICVKGGEFRVLKNREAILCVRAGLEQPTVEISHNPTALSRVDKIRGRNIGCFALDELPGVLGGTAPGAWEGIDPAGADAAAEALDLLQMFWPEGYRDVLGFATAIVALESAARTRAAVSSPALPGAVGLTLHRLTSYSLAELLLHEVAHLKIDLLKRSDPLLLDDGSLTHWHPWRSDPRTITGVLYAAHAFATALAWSKVISRRLPSLAPPRQETVRLQENLSQCAAYLGAHAEFTIHGRAFFDRLRKSIQLELG